MSTTDTERDERLRGIQKRADAATEGPWSVDGPAQPGPDDTLAVYVDGGTVAYVQPVVDDAEFIAAARADVPWLLAEVARLDAVVTAVREALSGHPRCDQHPDDDPVTCGWKRAVADVQSALDGGAA